jgi:LysR family glycine cleavage system transcriptional activator
MLPDLTNLECFDAAATHLNFRAAANTVGLSPAAFSERIRRLEDTVGAVLFTRTTRRVRLTPEGERLLPQARATLVEARLCVDSLRSQGPAPFELTIGTRYELGMSWVLPSITALEKARPEQQLHLWFSQGPTMMEALLRGQIDAVIGSMRLVSRKLQTMPLHEERYVFVGHPELLAESPIESLEDVSAHTLVDINPGLPLFRYFQDMAPVESSWRFGGHSFMGSIAAIRRRVLEGLGVAVLPEYFVEPDLKSGALLRILPHLQCRTDWFRLVWLEGHTRSDDLMTMGQFLRKRTLQ